MLDMARPTKCLRDWRIRRTEEDRVRRSELSSSSLVSRALSLVGVPLALAACTVGPDFKKPKVSVPEGWSAKSDPRIATQTAADSRWWSAFNDPALDRLIATAYRQNPSLQIAGLRIVEARAFLGFATGLRWPQVQEVSGRANVVGVPKGPQELSNILGARTFGFYQVGFDAAWEPDLWGKYGRGVEAQAANLLASVADYYSGLVSLTAEVARTYATIREFEVLIEEARENVRLQEQGLEIAESHFRNGTTTELDVTQASTLLESVRASVPKLQTSVQHTRNALSTLLGQSTGTVDVLITGPKGVPIAPAKVAVSLPAEMLRRRPDIRRAELDAAAQCARIGVAKAQLYPSFSLAGTIGVASFTGGNASQNFLSTDSLYGFAGPQVNFPLFNYGRLENGVRVQDARFQQLLVAHRDTVKSAKRSVDISMAAYRNGAVDFQRVLDAERALLERQTDLTKTRSSVVTSLIALYKALGGGWEWSQGQPFVPERTQKEMKERTNWGDLLSEPRAPETKDKNRTLAPANR
jgi:NodT family efflux transporter outer membrane factor (OMF) lipoprotein